MDRFEALIRAVIWLWKRDWGRSLLLAFPSLFALAAIPGKMSDAILDGPVFRAGFYIGTIVMPRETAGGHSLFGLAADCLVLAGLWFIVLLLVHRSSANEKPHVTEA